MRVFFDGKIFSSQRRGGISRLFFELMSLFGQTQRLEQILYKGAYIDQYPFKKEWFKKCYGFRRPVIRGYRLIKIFDDMCMELTYNLNADSGLIYHSTYYRVPRRPQGPVVVHAYDMIHELFGGDSSTKELKKKAFDLADLIVSISEATKKDICEIYQIDSKKIIVVYPGVSNIFRLQNSDISGNLTTEKNNERPYVLYVGNRGWYKNFDLLLNTFIRRKYFNDFDLVLAGGEKKFTVRQKEALSKCSGKRPWIKHKAYNDTELAELYSKAKAFIFPSLYEGFGLSSVEAMACGCPVIASNTSSISEVVGDAALLFNPEDPDDLGRKMDILISDKSVSIDLIRKGRLRAQRFTWEAMADAVYEGYSRLI
jgi:glycosyltransferase involved in cell wall biosynthesis